MLNEVLKFCEKLSADVKLKAKRNQKTRKDLVALSQKFSPSKLEIQCKKDMYFSFDLG